jgi:hypothetical protein
MAINFEMMLGSMITQTLSTAAWLIGFLIHLMIGGLFGLIYALGFERVTHSADWRAGIGIGALHTVFSGLLLAVVPSLHPLMPRILEAPGVFLANLGPFAVVVFIAVHLGFGAMVGSLYGPVLHPVPRTIRPRPADAAV